MENEKMEKKREKIRMKREKRIGDINQIFWRRRESKQIEMSFIARGYFYP